MNCPNCNKRKMGVEETRTTPTVIWRVRRCRQCGWRVTTKELYATDEEQGRPYQVRERKRKRERELKAKHAAKKAAAVGTNTVHT